MKKSVVFSEISGAIKAPASKSSLQRLIALSYLCRERVEIEGVTLSNDALAAAGMVESLGAVVTATDSLIIIEDGDKEGRRILDSGESGLGIRMFSPVAALDNYEHVITAAGSLRQRPAAIIRDALSSLGVEVSLNGDFPPIKLKGPLKGGNVSVDGSLSSQLLTGLLIALPAADGDSEIKVSNLKSRPYIDMTIELVNLFGGEILNENYSRFAIKGKQKYKSPGRIMCEGDWSSAAFFIVAGALSGRMLISNLRSDSRQADRAVADVVRSTGASVEFNGDTVEVEKTLNLSPFRYDATDSPDLFPPLAALASACNGISYIKGVSRLKHKESDREKSIINEFGKAGIMITVENDWMKIRGGDFKPCEADSNNDHRIAMAMAVAALRSSGKVVINGIEAVSKSYPEFFRDLEKSGGNISE